jgi:DNA invertase Pin-like site-specific DNA recombinase
MIHLYARVSTDKQENSREAQASRLLTWVGDKGYQLWVDEDVSAYRNRRPDRPAGKQMYDALEEGDTVVITKIDRAFRRMYDFAVTREQWEKLGVQLVILDLPENLSGPHGRFFLSVIVAAGELESEMHGLRKREVYAHKQRQGVPYGTLRPFGWEVKKTAAGMEWIPNDRERAACQQAIALKEQGKSLWEIAIALSAAGVKKTRRKKGCSDFYHVKDIHLMCRAAAAGYPKIARESLRGPGYEQRLAEARSRGRPL